MLNLSLTAVSRGEVPVRGEVAADDPIWEGLGQTLATPLRVEMVAHEVGEGVLVRGEIETVVDTLCRRCLEPVRREVKETVDLLYEPLDPEEEVELGGEVYSLPERGDEVDLRPALREQLLLRVPEFVVCDEACRGLCPKCGANRNQTTCACVQDEPEGPWGALKTIKFD